MRSKGIDQEMKATKPASLREKTVPELEQMLEQERAALYKARRDLVFRQSTDVASLKQRRHNIARILTVINEKKQGEKP
jgi:large subunit ribosomal protein L29